MNHENASRVATLSEETFQQIKALNKKRLEARSRAEQRLIDGEIGAAKAAWWVRAKPYFDQ